MPWLGHIVAWDEGGSLKNVYLRPSTTFSFAGQDIDRLVISYSGCSAAWAREVGEGRPGVSGEIIDIDLWCDSIKKVGCTGIATAYDVELIVDNRCMEMITGYRCQKKRQKS